jgi:hypothetical protein
MMMDMATRIEEEKSGSMKMSMSRKTRGKRVEN